MMTKNAYKNRTQIQYFCMDDLVPEDHLHLGLCAR